MPRSKDYIRINKEKFYYVLALFVTRGGEVSKRLAETKVYYSLMGIELDEEKLVLAIKIIMNGYYMNGDKKE